MKPIVYLRGQLICFCMQLNPLFMMTSGDSHLHNIVYGPIDIIVACILVAMTQIAVHI